MKAVLCLLGLHDWFYWASAASESFRECQTKGCKRREHFNGPMRGWNLDLGIIQHDVTSCSDCPLSAFASCSVASPSRPTEDVLPEWCPLKQGELRVRLLP